MWFRADLLSKRGHVMAVHENQPSDTQAVSRVVSRQSRHGAFLENHRDKQVIL